MPFYQLDELERKKSSVNSKIDNGTIETTHAYARI